MADYIIILGAGASYGSIYYNNMQSLDPEELKQLCNLFDELLKKSRDKNKIYFRNDPSLLVKTCIGVY